MAVALTSAPSSLVTPARRTQTAWAVEYVLRAPDGPPDLGTGVWLAESDRMKPSAACGDDAKHEGDQEAESRKHL